MEAGSNIFGIDVRGLDVAAFLAQARVLYVLLALAWLVLTLRLRRPRLLLLGVLLANALVWFETMYPLQRVYGLGHSGDRVNLLAMSQVAAAGNSPLETWQVGQRHLEPHGRLHNISWVGLVALLTRDAGEPVFRFFMYAPLVMVLGFAVALYVAFGWKGSPFSRWERALIAAFGTLLSTAPFDSLSVYRPPWTMMFLLKPNHALALVLSPLVLAAFAAIKGWRGRVVVAVLLHALAWAFVLHAAYIAAGVAVFAGLSLLARHSERWRDVKDAGSVLGLNALVLALALGYVLMRSGLPFSSSATGERLLRTSPHFLVVTAQSGWLFLLGAWGAWVAWARGGRIGRLWAGQLAAGYLMWFGYPVLSLLGRAEQPDELFIWVRFFLGVSAAIGAVDLAKRAAERWPRLKSEALSAVAIAALALPYSLPYWWNPLTMDLYFKGSLTPLPADIADLGQYLRQNTQPGDVMAGDFGLAPYAAAVSGRRWLRSLHLPATRDQDRRAAVDAILLSDVDPAQAIEAARTYGVTHVVVRGSFLQSNSLTAGELAARRHLNCEWLTGDPETGAGLIVVYRITGTKAGDKNEGEDPCSKLS
jgi:hypothetical protein